MINTSEQHNTPNQIGNPLPMMAFAYPELGKLTQDVAAANEGQLRLFVAGINTDDVTFLSFDSDGHSLSSDYRFNFMLELTNVVDLSNVIGRRPMGPMWSDTFDIKQIGPTGHIMEDDSD